MRLVRWFILVSVFAPLAGAQEKELLYVGNNHGGTISVIDVPRLEVIGEFDALPDLPDPPRGRDEFVDDLVASPEGRLLYVSRTYNRDVAAFDTATETLLFKVPIEGKPDHMALSPDGRYLFLSVYSEGIAAVIDTETREIAGRFPTGPMPHGMRMSPDGKRIYNGALGADRITIADAATFEVVKTIELDQGVRPFTVTRDEKKLYTQLSRFHGFVEVDLEEGRVTKSIHLPVPDGVEAQASYPHTAHHGIELSPDERHLCAAGTVADYVAVLSHPTLDLLATIPVGSEPSWIITSLDGRYCYVSSRLSDTVSVISIEDRKEVKRIAVGDYPQRMWTVKVPRREVPTSSAPARKGS